MRSGACSFLRHGPHLNPQYGTPLFAHFYHLQSAPSVPHPPNSLAIRDLSQEPRDPATTTVPAFAPKDSPYWPRSPGTTILRRTVRATCRPPAVPHLLDNRLPPPPPTTDPTKTTITTPPPPPPPLPLPGPNSVAGKMADSDTSRSGPPLPAQDPLARELIQGGVEEGVLVPLKTTLELRDDYQTGHVLITRTPTKSANPAILYARYSPNQTYAFPFLLSPPPPPLLNDHFISPR